MDNGDAGAKILLFIGGLILSIAALVYAGWALTLLWGWFVVPLGVASISFGLALGIIVLLNLLRQGSSISLQQIKNKLVDDEVEIWVNLVISPFGSMIHTTITLVFGVLINAIFL